MGSGNRSGDLVTFTDTFELARERLNRDLMLALGIPEDDEMVYNRVVSPGSVVMSPPDLEGSIRAPLVMAQPFIDTAREFITSTKYEPAVIIPFAIRNALTQQIEYYFAVYDPKWLPEELGGEIHRLQWPRDWHGYVHNTVREGGSDVVWVKWANPNHPHGNMNVQCSTNSSNLAQYNYDHRSTLFSPQSLDAAVFPVDKKTFKRAFQIATEWNFDSTTK